MMYSSASGREKLEFICLLSLRHWSCVVCVRAVSAKLAQIPSYILQIEFFKEKTFFYLFDTLGPFYDTL